MSSSLLFFSTALGQPLFGNQWLALLAMLGCIAILMAAVWAVGQWLASTHPDALKPDPAGHIPANDNPDPATSAPTPELLAVISAAVVASYGPKAHVVAVQTLHMPTADALMLQWSLEGRRQIYTSHNLR